MGRGRKPLEMQKGDLTVAKQEQMKAAEESVTVGKEQFENPPRWLVSKTAKAEYRRLVTEMKKISIIGNLDLNNLACYCNAYAMYRDVVALASAHPTDKEIIDALKKHTDEMRKFAALCGLTVDSRLKIGTLKTEKADDEISARFGAI